MAAPTLNLEEYQFGDAGVLLNGTTDLPFFDVTSVQGLDSAPIRTLTVDHEGIDGGYVDSEFESIRTVVLEGTLYASPTNMETYLDSLKANFAPDNVNKPLYFQTDAGQRMVLGKGQGLRYNKDQLRRLGRASAQVQVMCEDPRIYSPSPVSGSVSLVPGTTFGRSYPKSFPFSYGATVTQGSLVLNLSGNRPSPGVLRIDGAIVNPSIINDTTGSVMSFNLTVDPGSWITIDLSNRSVTLNDSQSIRSFMLLTGRWFMMTPGANSFRLQGEQTPSTPVAILTATAYSAWR